jgi:histidine triad (HIT) family protein
VADDCIFCAIVAGDIPATKIDEDDRVVAFMDQKIARRAVRGLGADGVNLLNSCGEHAWQTVFHFHLHVIPRYQNDPLQLPWNPHPGDLEDISAAAAVLRATS